MEILSRLLAESAIDKGHFGFHPRCQNLKLTHLCFANDLLIFIAVDMASITIVKNVLGEFEELSGLKANPTKSTVFYAGLPVDLKHDLLNCLQMEEGILPVKYLGVPLISKRLSAVDCKSLFSKITARIDSWLVQHLSFAGRLHLISSIFSLQVFWARVFILPKRVIRLLEQKFNKFLWCGRDTKANAKVSWDKVCVPKRE
jgi:hypothetical protein